jgi:hypothetical protein
VRRIFSLLVDNLSFHHQLSNELTDGAVADNIIHSIHTDDSIIICAFLLVIEMQMSGRVIFRPAGDDFFRSNSAAINALGLNPLAPSSLSLYYIMLGWQPLVVFPSMRT